MPRILPKFTESCPKKTLKKMTSKSDCISFHFGRIFLNQSASSTIFAQISPKLAQISPKLPKKELKKRDLQKKKCLHFDFRRHFCKIKAHKAILRRFSHILPKFTQILLGL